MMISCKCKYKGVYFHGCVQMVEWFDWQIETNTNFPNFPHQAWWVTIGQLLQHRQRND